MAGNAVCRGHFATYRSGFAAAMASLALRIVSDVIAVDLLVRVMARCAADTGIVGVVALTAGKPVRLKPDIRDAEHPRASDLVPSAMALAAKIACVLRSHLAEIFHSRQLKIALLDSRNVILRRSVAALALHAGRQRIESELITLQGLCRMTSEAADRLRASDRPSCRLQQVFRF